MQIYSVFYAEDSMSLSINLDLFFLNYCEMYKNITFTQSIPFSTFLKVNGNLYLMANLAICTALCLKFTKTLC